MKILKNENTFITFLLVSVLSLSTNVFSAPIPKAPKSDVSSYILVDYDSGMVIASIRLVQRVAADSIHPLPLVT